jgi:hypothetical protein
MAALRFTGRECDRTGSGSAGCAKKRRVDGGRDTRQLLGGAARRGSILRREQDVDSGTKRLGSDGRISPLLQFAANRNRRGFDLSLCEAEQREARVRIASRLARTSIQLVSLLKFSAYSV